MTETVMLNKLLITALLGGLLSLHCGVVVLFADEGEEVIQAHRLPMYPGSVQEVPTDQTIMLTKDKFAVVKQYFEAHKQAGDRVEGFQKDNETGIHLVYHKTINGKDQSVLEVTFTSRNPDTNFHNALGELYAQVTMGRHSQSEYEALKEKYKDLHLAYFRQVEDGQGRIASEGEVIYRKAYNAAHPKKQSPASDAERATGKANAQDLKKQMQALKASGDYAGMAQLAQQANKSPDQTSSGAAAIASMNQDTWELWVKCLEDISKAAFWTRLHYNSNALVQ